MGNTVQKIVDKLPWDKTPPPRLLIQGLDSSGKTTFLYQYTQGKNVTTTIPTIGFNIEKATFNGSEINVWDVGGRSNIRPLWRHYYTDTQGIIFMVDSNDRERISWAKDELQRLLAEEILKDVPVLVVGNKVDLPYSLGLEELKEQLDFVKQTQDRKSHITMCSALNTEDVNYCMKWMHQVLV